VRTLQASKELASAHYLVSHKGGIGNLGYFNT